MLYTLCVIVGQALQVATPEIHFFCNSIAGLVACICFLMGHAHLLPVRNGLCLPHSTLCEPACTGVHPHGIGKSCDALIQTAMRLS